MSGLGGKRTLAHELLRRPDATRTPRTAAAIVTARATGSIVCRDCPRSLPSSATDTKAGHNARRTMRSARFRKLARQSANAPTAVMAKASTSRTSGRPCIVAAYHLLTERAVPVRNGSKADIRCPAPMPRPDDPPSKRSLHLCRLAIRSAPDAIFAKRGGRK